MAIAHLYYRSGLSLSLCYQLFFVDMMKHLNPHCISNMYPYTTDKSISHSSTKKLPLFKTETTTENHN